MCMCLRPAPGGGGLSLSPLGRKDEELHSLLCRCRVETREVLCFRGSVKGGFEGGKGLLFNTGLLRGLRGGGGCLVGWLFVLFISTGEGAVGVVAHAMV